jgi:hypothetical protein
VYDHTYTELVLLSKEHTSSECRDILARILPFRLDQVDFRVAIELVQWYYENMDLGLTCFDTEGVHVTVLEMPRLSCGKPTPPGDLPTLDIRYLQKVLETDLFGVGITPSDCKLRALSVLVNHRPTYGNNRLWARPVPFKQTLTCAALDTMLSYVLSQPKTDNFKLQMYALAWSMGPRDSRNSLALAAKVYDTSTDAELLENNLEVKPVYFEYLLQPGMEFEMVSAYGSEDLGRAVGWDNDNVREEPLFATWEEWNCEYNT